MPLFRNNRFFETGLNGYVLHGRHARQTAVQYNPTQTSGECRILEPLRGDHLLVLDDPTFGVQGARPDYADGIKPIKTNRYRCHSADDKYYIGMDGSVLECRNVNIPAGSVLWYAYAFLPFASAVDPIFNSFALFAAYDQISIDNHQGHFIRVPRPYFTEILGQSRDIPPAMRAALGWRLGVWQPPHQGFTGTVCWIVSTGRRFGVGTGAQCPPSMLLLGAIEIKPVTAIWSGIRVK